MRSFSLIKMTRSLLKNKKVLVGITGSVAAYKAPDLIRRIIDGGASVDAIMTDASCRFITPLSVELATSGGKVYRGMFDSPLAHIELARTADAFVIAPATANTIGRMAAGLADDLISAVFMAFRGRTIVAPAMNWRMYESPAFRRNLDTLKNFGIVEEVPPARGMLACGEEGAGKLASVEDILDALASSLTEKDMAGKKVLVTAGPTREPIDVVRYISNRSSGKMGYALARVAHWRGAQVTLVSGPSELDPPRGVSVVNVNTALEMEAEVMARAKGCDAIIMSAAVADFRPESASSGKRPKEEIGDSIRLTRNPDILAGLGAMSPRPVLIGFAAHSGDSTDAARRKLMKKGADYIVFNNIAKKGAGFEVDTNDVIILGHDFERPTGLKSKEEIASDVLDIVIGKGLD